MQRSGVIEQKILTFLDTNQYFFLRFVEIIFIFLPTQKLCYFFKESKKKNEEEK